MAHVVTEPCINCKHTNCVAVCPVECFHEGKNFLVIDPVVCIDCGLCVYECPVSAIYADDMLPGAWHDFIEVNARFAKKWPRIKKSQNPLPTAPEFRQVHNKRDLLDPNPPD